MSAPPPPPGYYPPPPKKPVAECEPPKRLHPLVKGVLTVVGIHGVASCLGSIAETTANIRDTIRG